MSDLRRLETELEREAERTASDVFDPHAVAYARGETSMMITRRTFVLVAQSLLMTGAKLGVRSLIAKERAHDRDKQK
jgi:hypothetical protein